MLEIINQRGEIMELEPGMTIPVERNNPLFNDADKFFQDITYPGKAPISPANKAFFGSGHLVDALNEVYEFGVQVYVNSEPIFAGLCVYKATANYYDFNLKVNLAALANRLKNTKLPEIRTNDRPNLTLSETQWEDHMKNTCVNPQDYNYAFFPVVNTGVAYSDKEVSTITNLYDYENQRFELKPPGGKRISSDYMMFNTPYFKLTYVVKKVIEGLGFKATGNFFNAVNDQIYIWSPHNATDWTRNSSAATDIIWLNLQPSLFYAPNLTIAEFFKVLKEDPRLRLVFNFNVFNSIIQVDSFKDIITDPESMDIAEFVSDVTEISLTSTPGFSVTLQPDPADELFVSNGKPIADKKLVVGDGSKIIEIAADTLKTYNGYTVACKRPLLFFKSIIIPNYVAYPPPLRLVRFRGMLELQPGKFMPQSESMPLQLNHADFYEFLSNAKKLKVTATLPINELAAIDPTKKVSFYHRGITVSMLLEKVTYDLQSGQRLRVNLEGYSLANSSSTSSSRLEPILPIDAEGGTYDADTVDIFQAYFKPETGIASIKPECVKAGWTIDAQEIKVPTDESGGGGQLAVVVKSGNVAYVTSYQLRIREAKPQYAERLGFRYEFTQGPGYWYTEIHETLFDRSSSSVLKGYYSPLWIVF